MTSTSRTLDASGYDTDKSTHPGYLRNYEDFFESLLEREVRLLELGIQRSGSLLLWRDYFPRGLIVGLDIEPVQLGDPTGRIRVYQGGQQDTELLDRIARETAPAGFDVIIDDCSHIGQLARVSFWHLFENHLKSGGFYVLGDWGPCSDLPTSSCPRLHRLATYSWRSRQTGEQNYTGQSSGEGSIRVDGGLRASGPPACSVRKLLTRTRCRSLATTSL